MSAEQAVAARQPDSMISWKYYELIIDEVCRQANIHVPPNAEIEAEIPERGLLRLTVKSEAKGSVAVIELDRAGAAVYGARTSQPDPPLEQARAIARQLWTVIRTGAPYPDDLANHIQHDTELYWLRELAP